MEQSSAQNQTRRPWTTAPCAVSEQPWALSSLLLGSWPTCHVTRLTISLQLPDTKSLQAPSSYRPSPSMVSAAPIPAKDRHLPRRILEEVPASPAARMLHRVLSQPWIQVAVRPATCDLESYRTEGSWKPSPTLESRRDPLKFVACITDLHIAST